MQTIEIIGDRAFSLYKLLEADGWQLDGSFLKRGGSNINIQASIGVLKEGALPLGSDINRAKKILAWFTDFEVQKARPSDLDEICQLKSKQIEENFLFLSPKERRREIKKYAAKDYMRQEIKNSDFWVCKRNQKIAACGGLKESDFKEGTVYSGYSLGDGAGAALLSLRIKEARKRGYKKLWAYTYGYNDQGVKHLKYQGFRLSNRLKTSDHNPPHRIRYWSLELV